MLTKSTFCVAFALSLWTAGCAAHAPMQASMKPLDLGAPPVAAVLEEDHFNRDRIGTITEEHLRTILAAPAFLEADSRVGIVQVSSGYEADSDLPLTGVTAHLAKALSDTGEFEIVTEVSTDWPSTSSVAGLRELAARYRAEYLLLYRHRFVDRDYANAWAIGYVTIVGALFLPGNTLETAGVVEATLFDVRTGTLMFTIFERVSTTTDENVWQNDRKRRAVKADLLQKAQSLLAKDVVAKVQRLASVRTMWEQRIRAASPALKPALDGASGTDIGVFPETKKAEPTVVDSASR